MRNIWKRSASQETITKLKNIKPNIYCNRCDKRFQTTEDFYVHMKSIHSSKEDRKKNVGGVIVRNPSALQGGDWYSSNWSKRSVCAALRRCSETKCPLYLGFFFFSFLSPPHTFLPEGVVLGFWVWVWVLSHKNNKIWGRKQSGTHTP